MTRSFCGPLQNGIPFGVDGFSLYVAPAALALAFLRFFRSRKVNRELTIMFLGLL